MLTGKTRWIAGVVFSICAMFGSAALAAPTMTLSASTTTPAVGGTFTVTVNLSGQAAFDFFGEYLTFDNTKLALVSQAVHGSPLHCLNPRVVCTACSHPCMPG